MLLIYICYVFCFMLKVSLYRYLLAETFQEERQYSTYTQYSTACE